MAMGGAIRFIPYVSVVEQIEQGAVCDFEVGKVLMRKPRVGRGGLNCEIAAVAEPPENVSAPCAIVVVDFDHPVLMAGGIEKAPVVRQSKRISMHPVIGFRRKVERRAKPIGWSAYFI